MTAGAVSEPSRSRTRHPPLQCGCPCDLVVCCKNPNDRCAALLFLAQRTLTAAAQHGQKLYPTAPGYPPEPNYPEGKAPATVGRVVPEEEQYFGFWDERATSACFGFWDVCSSDCYAC